MFGGDGGGRRLKTDSGSTSFVLRIGGESRRAVTESATDDYAGKV